MLFSLAIKNISRKKSRSLLAITGITVAVFALSLSTGLVLGIEERALEPVRIIFGGDVLVTPREFRLVEEAPGSYTFKTGDEKGECFIETQELEEILEEKGMGMPDIYPVLYVKCYLLDYDMDLSMVMGRNIERDITEFHLDTFTYGRYFSEDDKGEEVAVIDMSSEWGGKNLNIGDTISVLLPEVEVEGSRAVLDFGSGKVINFEIVGFYSGGIVSTSAIWVPAETLRNLTGIEDEATYAALTMRDPLNAERLEADVDKALPVTILTISAIMEVLSKDFGEFRQFIRTVVFIAYAVSALVMTNVMLAAVVERRHEIGILKSIGAKNNDIMFMIVCESALLGLCGGLTGFFSGSVMASAFSKTFPFDMGTVAANIALVIIVCCIAGLYPAARAARVPAMEVLRYE
jgi:ABC-type antimicrobial peptide transport system permease subunit